MTEDGIFFQLLKRLPVFLRLLEKSPVTRTYLAMEEHGGALSVQEAADCLGISYDQSRRHLNELVHMQLVEREPDPRDDRNRQKLYRCRKMSVVDDRTPRERAGL